MQNRLIPLIAIPLFAVFMGWSIQPVGYVADTKVEAKTEWPDVAVTEFHASTEDQALAMITPATARHDLYAVNQ